MPEFKDTVIWQSATPSEFYLSRFSYSADNPLATLKVKQINTLVTYNKQTGNFGPCYSIKYGNLYPLEKLLSGPLGVVLHQSLYEALKSLNNSDFRLGEFDVRLENGISVSNLTPDDLLVNNSNQGINTLLLEHELKITKMPKLEPFRIYEFDRCSGCLIKTKHCTEDIINFVICNPHLFYDLPEDWE